MDEKPKRSWNTVRDFFTLRMSQRREIMVALGCSALIDPDEIEANRYKRAMEQVARDGLVGDLIKMVNQYKEENNEHR